MERTNTESSAALPYAASHCVGHYSYYGLYSLQSMPTKQRSHDDIDQTIAQKLEFFPAVILGNRDVLYQSASYIIKNAIYIFLFKIT